MKRTTLLIIALLQTIFVSLLAQPSHSIRTFTVRDGLPANNITAIKQGPRGLIWVATWNGLCCYDGYRFTTFLGEPWGSEHALTTQRISAIEPDSEGNVWVRTYDDGLYLLDGERCQYINMGVLLKEKFGTDFIPHNIYNIAGHTWITNAKKEQIVRAADNCPTLVDSIIQWDSKLFWDKVFPQYRVGENKGCCAEKYIQENHIGKHCIDRQGNLWFVNKRGLSLVNFKNYHMHLLPLEEGAQTRSLLCRKDGSVWAGNYNGYIGVYDADGKQLGWVSPQGKVVAGKVQFSELVYALLEDRSGNVWVGTKGNGVYVIAADGGNVRHYTHSDSDPYSLSHNEIFGFDQDADGNVWIATYGGGVNLIKNEELRFKSGEMRFLHAGNEMKRYPKEGFKKTRRITHDQKGNMLVSTTEGLLTFSAQEKNIGNLPFYVTKHNPTDTTSLRTNDVAQVLVAKDGTIYVVTMGGGVQRIVTDQLLQNDLRLQSVTAMNQGEGSPLSIAEDQYGKIWITREAEVNRYNPKDGTLVQFGPNSIVDDTDLTEAQTAVHPNGSLWAGALGGVLTFHPKEMHKNTFQPLIVFTGIQYQGEQDIHPFLRRPQLDITESDQRSLTIHFAALDYENDYLMQYAYRLAEDESGKWNYIGRDPSISFSQLRPGKHTLIVRSTNADGVWCNNEATLTIHVEPMLWERVWFRILLLLLVIGLSTWSVLTWLRRRQQHREREQRLESIMRQYSELQEQSREQAHSVKYALSEPEIVNPDEEMMNQLMAFIEQRISDENLRIEDMADAVGMGRTVFYGKIKELMGVSPSDFLKQIRMQRAEQLIRKSKMTFSEIAYAVGFTDPKYFTKCFKKQTGLTPSEYRSQESVVE